MERGRTLQIEQLPSGRWRVRLNDARLNKKVNVKGTFRTKAEATAAGHRAELEFRAEGQLHERKDTTLGDLCDRYLDTITHLAPTTQASYANALKRAREHFGEGKSVRRISREECAAYAARLVRMGKAPKTVRTYVKALGTVLTLAVEWSYRSDNPALKLRNLPEDKARDGVRVLTPEEHARVVAAASHDVYRVMFSVWPFIGLRVAEMQGLRWQDIDFDAQTIMVRFQLREDGTFDPKLKSPKSKRRVQMCNRVATELKAWKLRQTPNEYDLVFPTVRGRPQRCRSRFYAMWKKVSEKAELAGQNPYSLRHSFATWNLSAKANVKWVAEQMGHEDASITLNTYAHLLSSEDPTEAQLAEQWHARRMTSNEGSGHIPATSVI